MPKSIFNVNSLVDDSNQVDLVVKNLQELALLAGNLQRTEEELAIQTEKNRQLKEQLKAALFKKEQAIALHHEKSLAKAAKQVTQETAAKRTAQEVTKEIGPEKVKLISEKPN